MDTRDISLWFSGQISTPTPLIKVFSQYLSALEAAQIFEQFQSNKWISNGQVLWSGIAPSTAQTWANRHHLQTLTTAMGPLTDGKHPDCLRVSKTPKQWSQYMRGASAVFAWHIARGQTVTLLSPPPPERFHPTGLSNYQAIEKPILQGRIGECAVEKIMTVHPIMPECEEFSYEIWPEDMVSTWTERFGQSGKQYHRRNGEIWVAARISCS